MTENVVGVDVAKDWIDSYDLASGKSRRVEMTPAALKKFAGALTGKFLVFEASGDYERPLMDALIVAGVGYTRVNPRHAREFARATGRLAKTDQVDAAVLARMGAALELLPDAPRNDAADRLAMLVARREALVEQRKQEKQRLHQCTDGYIRKDITSHIRLLMRRIAKLETEMDDHIASDDQLADRNQQMLSAPGVGKVVSATLLAKLPELGSINRRAIANLAGLAPHACDSGYMRGKRMIWGGRADVRRALYVAAFTASRFDPEHKAYRKKLTDAGKPHKVAIIAIARRLLVQINCMIRENRNYVHKPA